METANKQVISDLISPAVSEEISEMLKAGVHVGHVSSKTHPAMAEFIFANRGGVAVFDLVKTKEKLSEAEAFIKKMAADKKIFLFVGTKPAARNTIKNFSEAEGVPAVTERWVGGTLTNWKVIFGRMQALEALLREKAEGEFKKYTKKEAMKKDEEILHLEKTFGGLRGLKRVPDVLVLADTDEDNLALREAERLNIPTVAIVNSNQNPNDVRYAIPANDNSISSVAYIFGKLRKAFQEGKESADKHVSE